MGRTARPLGQFAGERAEVGAQLDPGLGGQVAEPSGLLDLLSAAGLGVHVPFYVDRVLNDFWGPAGLRRDAPTVKSGGPSCALVVPSLRTLTAQFELARKELHEVDHLYKAGYWASTVSHAYQTVLHAAAGLLYAREVRPLTEREVRIAFHGAFIAHGDTPQRFDGLFRRLERMRHLADFEHDHDATEPEAKEALEAAHAFWEEAQRVAAKTGLGPAKPRDPGDAAPDPGSHG